MLKLWERADGSTPPRHDSVWRHMASRPQALRCVATRTQPCSTGPAGAALRVAEQRKRATYPELAFGGLQRLVVRADVALNLTSDSMTAVPLQRRQCRIRLGTNGSSVHNEKLGSLQLDALQFGGDSTDSFNSNEKHAETGCGFALADALL